MHNTRYIVVPTSEVINKMISSSPIRVDSNDGRTVFSYLGDKPSCFNSYDSYSLKDWEKKCMIDEANNWGYPEYEE